MGIVLFAIIGATIKAGAAFWICFTIYCLIKLIKYIAYAVKILDEV
jgi:uncharacterized membrane protein